MSSAADQRRNNVLTFEEGWPVLEEAVDKLIGTLEVEGLQTHRFQVSSEEYMRLYTIVYNICSHNPIGPDSQKLYDQYKKVFENYITSKVLPSLRGKKEEILLQELLKRWESHKLLTRWLSRIFHYLDRFFTGKKKLPTTRGTGHLTFYELVYGEFNDQVKDAVISMIDGEREGEEIDQALVKNVLNIYMEMGEGSKKFYEKDFEEALLKDTAAFYSLKASEWIMGKSYEDYMLKVDGCLRQERENFLLPNTKKPKQVIGGVTTRVADCTCKQNK